MAAAVCCAAAWVKVGVLISFVVVRHVYAIYLSDAVCLLREFPMREECTLVLCCIQNSAPAAILFLWPVRSRPTGIKGGT